VEANRGCQCIREEVEDVVEMMMMRSLRDSTPPVCSFLRAWPWDAPSSGQKVEEKVVRRSPRLLVLRRGVQTYGSEAVARRLELGRSNPSSPVQECHRQPSCEVVRIVLEQSKTLWLRKIAMVEGEMRRAESNGVRCQKMVGEHQVQGADSVPISPALLVYPGVRHPNYP